MFSIVATVKVNAHPPSSVLFFLPFGLLPYGLSYLAWNALSAACLGFAASVLARELDITLSRTAFVLIAILGFAGGPVFEQMVFGQTNAVTLGFLVLAWRAHRRGQVQEGCWLGAAAAMLFPWSLRRPLRRSTLACRRRAPPTSSSLTLPLVLFGTNTWSEFIAKGMPGGRLERPVAERLSVGVLEETVRLAKPGQSRAVRGAVAYWVGYSLSIALLALATTWLIVFRHRDIKGDRSYAIGICAMLLLSPTCWPHYFLMLIIPLAILWHEHRDSVAHRRVVATCFVLLFAPAGVYMVLFVGGGVVGPLVAVTALAVQTYVILGMWALAGNRQLIDLFSRTPLAPPEVGTASVKTPSQAA